MNGLVVRTTPAGLRNGLPEPGGYVYRGTGKDVLTAWMDDPRQRPFCGRLMPSGKVCGRREGHLDHCTSEETMAGHRRRSRRRPRKARQRRASPLTARQERINAIASLRFAADGVWVPTAGVVTVQQAAEMLGVSERTVERYKRELRAAS